MSFIPSDGLEDRLAESAEMKKACERFAEKTAKTAQQIAPVGDPEEDDHPGQFAEGIHADGTAVVSSDPASRFIIFGTSRTPPHDTLRRAAEINGGRIKH